MKVLVAYYSETGNTEKIARAIYEEASKGHEVHLKRISELTAKDLNGYDLVFLGSACHSTDLAAPVKKILDALPDSPSFKLAGFFTHSTYTQGDSVRERKLFNRWASKCILSFKKVSKEKQIPFRGYYHCQGVPTPAIQAFIRREIITSADEWAEYIEEAGKHPSPEDLQKAKEFAKKILSEL